MKRHRRPAKASTSTRNAIWRGHLRLSLVTVPVSVLPATTESGRVRFHVLNRKTGNRVESRYVDSITRKPVADQNQVKGFPRDESDSDYVIVEDEEIDAVAPESNRIIDIGTFVPAGSIDWIWHDTPHFLVSDDPLGVEAMSIIQQAMTTNEVVGIARLVLYKHERTVMIEPNGRGKGLFLWTLRNGSGVRSPTAELDDRPHFDRETLSSVKENLSALKSNWRSSFVEDPVQKKVMAFLDSRKTKPAPSRAKSRPGKPAKVINIMDLLEKSLRADKK